MSTRSYCSVLCTSLLTVSAVVHAQSPADTAFPVRPVRLIVAQPPGGPTDIAARIYALRLAEILGQQTVVDNRAGAGGSVAGELTVRSPADGYTLMVAANGTLAVAPHLIKLSYDASKDLTAVALIANSPLALMVHPAVPVKSTKELIALAKSRPGKINFGSSGPGATSHLGGELLKTTAGIDIVHVPYKGAGPALIALMSGEIDMLISGLSSGIPYIKQKKLRLVAVSSGKRVPLVPDVPSMAETLPGFDVSSWYAVLAPVGTPRAVIDKLSKASIAAVTTPDVQTKLTAAGMVVEPLSPQELTAKISKDFERWGKVVKTAGISAN